MSLKITVNFILQLDLKLPKEKVDVYKDILLEMLEEFPSGVRTDNLLRDFRVRMEVLGNPEIPRNFLLYQFLQQYLHKEAAVVRAGKWSWTRLESERLRLALWEGTTDFGNTKVILWFLVE